MPRAVVVGAGIAGAVCGRALADRGWSVTLLDKGRGPGGRLATRRAEDGSTFDHGAPWFSVRDPRVAALVERWSEQGSAARWEGVFGALGPGGFQAEDLGERWVGAPTSSALVRGALAGLEVRFGVRAESVDREGSGWSVAGERCDAVVVAVPAPQAVPLLAAAPALAARMAAVRVAPCWAAMVGLAAEPEVVFSAARVVDSPAGWVCREHTRPGRSPAPRWVIHGTAAWSEAHLEDPPESVAAALLGAIRERVVLPEPTSLSAHRWRFARVVEPVGEGALVDPSLRLAVCGDALLGGRVEDAIRSGLACAEALGAA